jgi:hypothetical protein
MTFSWRSTYVLLAVLLSTWNVADATKELDPSSFEELTKSGKNGMIKFFQPWCGHVSSLRILSFSPTADYFAYLVQIPSVLP